MRFAELDSFVDGVLNGGPLEQKLQAPGRVVLVMSVKFMASTTPPRKFQAKDKGFSNHSQKAISLTKNPSETPWDFGFLLFWGSAIFALIRSSTSNKKLTTLVDDSN